MGFGLANILNPFAASSKKLYGTKVEVPTLPTLQEAQATALAANKANFSEIAQAATQFNTLSQDQLNALLDKTIGVGAREQIQENFASGLRGELSPDVMNSIYRSRAAQGAAGNAFNSFAPGSFGGNGVFRDIVGTSYDITNRTLSSVESWLSQGRAPMLDAAKMFGISTDQQNAANVDQFNRNLLAAKIAAAPDPAARGEFDSNMAIIGMILSAYGGGAGYQNNYKPEAVSSGGGLTPSAWGGGGSSSFLAPQTAGFNTSYNSFEGLAGAAQSAGVNNPYSYGGYSSGGGGGLGGFFK